MSYITNGSNPEHLYIFYNSENIVEFNKGPEMMGTCNRNNLEYLCNEYNQNKHHVFYTFQDLTMERNLDTGFCELSGKNLAKIEMYFVTWTYFCNSVLNQRVTKPQK